MAEGRLQAGVVSGAEADRQPAPAAIPQRRVDVVIPAYNEEQRIGRTVRELAEHIDRRGLNARLVVVDNGSFDATAAVVDSAIRGRQTKVEVISCAARGKGAAVRAGILHSDAWAVGYCDADLPVPAEALSQAIGLLSAGWEVVVGSRRCAGASYEKEQSLARRCGSLAYKAASSRLRRGISDTQCGFKFFRTDVARSVFETSQIDGFGFDIEVLARVVRIPGVALIELPLVWSDQEGSSFRPVSDGLRSFVDLRHARRSVARWSAGDEAR